MSGIETKSARRPARVIRDRQPVAWLLVLMCAVGVGVIARHWTGTPWDVRAVELGGTVSARLHDPTVLNHLRDAGGDWWPVAGLVLLAAGGLLGRAVFAGRLSRRLSRAAGWALVVLAAVHLAENLLLGRVAANATPTMTHATPFLLGLQAVAFLGYALLPTAGLVAVIGAVTATVRLLVPPPEARPVEPAASVDDPTPPGDNAHWQESHRSPRVAGREPGGLGICLSGGGIRSATFALGAVQALQEFRPLSEDTGPPGSESPGSELTRARYLTAVSGGAYTAGALLHAAQPYQPEWDHARRFRAAAVDFDNAFRPGSPEFDHLRRRSSYIADGTKEWTFAILVVLRGALLSMVFLALVALTAGRWTGLLYHQIGRLRDFDDPWHPLWGATFATVAVGVTALAFWLLSTLAWLDRQPVAWRRVLAEIAAMTGVAFGVLVVLGAAIPIGTWLAMRVVTLGGGAGSGAGGAAKGGLVGVLGVVAAILGLVNNRRVEVAKAVGRQKERLRDKLGDLGNRVLAWLGVYVGLAAVAGVYLTVFGYSTYTSATAGPENHPVIRWGVPSWTSPLSNVQLTVAFTVLLGLLCLIVDETAMGLHSFYRRRLARAFAVRRVHREPTADEPGGYVALPYCWEERTFLETYGLVEGRCGPQVIFCASAHCSDADETPPGRHVLPFTYSHDWIGGPEVGWCPVAHARKRVSRRLEQDLTVQTAMAVSGAAFASAMGAYRGPANVVLALTNARLGTWMPNPGQLIAPGPRWFEPRPPRVRRMSYLIREICGWYPKELPMMFVTDGAHYESLGLVELLRHRCTEIYCFDASSDTETFAAALGHAVTLAADEFGVSVRLGHADRADPRTGDATVPRDLSGRLATSPIITGEIRYPPLGPGAHETTGIVVIGRATLDGQAPWEIGRHAAAHPQFPQDATGDQWFDDRRFNAYTGLGRHVGRRAVEAMAAALHTEAVRRGTSPSSMEEPHR